MTRNIQIIDERDLFCCRLTHGSKHCILTIGIRLLYATIQACAGDVRVDTLPEAVWMINNEYTKYDFKLTALVVEQVYLHYNSIVQ